MKRWLTHLTIVGYLTALGWGIVAHSLNFGTHIHPSMYFVVWDMFCGWAAYDTRNQVIVEGESGKFYEVLPAPWGEIHPYGDLGRRHYDPYQTFCMSMAQNVLKHTDHEPIARIFVLEEAWAKKFNLPDPTLGSPLRGTQIALPLPPHPLRLQQRWHPTPGQQQLAVLPIQHVIGQESPLASRLPPQPPVCDHRLQRDGAKHALPAIGSLELERRTHRLTAGALKRTRPLGWIGGTERGMRRVGTEKLKTHD